MFLQYNIILFYEEFLHIYTSNHFHHAYQNYPQNNCFFNVPVTFQEKLNIYYIHLLLLEEWHIQPSPPFLLSLTSLMLVL